ncbi:hypothetical protein ABZ079_01525 [Streptomyces sp. NPDC006314]|uniref:hypothetical protein n=1 Tax=Streptomyces sp. NPDC006314 TaxID=3154475 RepID=UPI0033A085DC
MSTTPGQPPAPAPAYPPAASPRLGSRRVGIEALPAGWAPRPSHGPRAGVAVVAAAAVTGALTVLGLWGCHLFRGETGPWRCRLGAVLDLVGVLSLPHRLARRITVDSARPWFGGLCGIGTSPGTI